MNIIVKEVITRKSLKEFVHFPNRLYRDNTYYVQQIESIDITHLILRKTMLSKFVKVNIGWLMMIMVMSLVVSPVLLNHYNKKINQKICKFAWIDFINDYNAAKSLLDKVENYAKEK